MVKQDLTLENFNRSYFYKTDLVKLCRSFGLPTYGTKAELNGYLKAFLSGVSKEQIKQVRHPQKTTGQINLETKLINVSFNNDARKFFAKYYHVDKFSFTKEMGIIKRRIQKEQNEQYTVHDLIEEITFSKNVEVPEEATYQWNNFVRDFCDDPATSNYSNKLKIASLLWQKVRDSTLDKKYDHRLLEDFKQNHDDE